MNIVVFGGTSAIAHEMNKIYATRQCRFVLVGRNQDRLSECGRDLLSRGAASVDVLVADLLYKDQHEPLLNHAAQLLGHIDVAVVAHATLPQQSDLDFDVESSLDNFLLNANSAISITHHTVLYMVKQGQGSVAVFSSIAGDRGRKRNYTYGAAKAALTAYTSGLRARFGSNAIHILTIKPGPVATPMLKGHDLPLQAKPEGVARSIVRAMDKGKHVIVVPGYWRIIMAVVKNLPEWIFMKLNI